MDYLSAFQYRMELLNVEVFGNPTNQTNSTLTLKKGIDLYPPESLYIFFVLCVPAVLLHIIGLYLLHKVKRRKLSRSRTCTNNKVLLNNLYLLSVLSVSEVVQTTNAVILVVSAIKKKITTVYVTGYINLTSAGFTLSSVFSITLNRLLSIVFPLRYNYNMAVTTKKIFIGFVCISIVFIVCIISGKLLSSSDTESSRTIGIVLFGSLFISFLVFCVISYCVIFYAIISSRSKEQNYVIPVLINITYTFFTVMPIIIQMTCGFSNSTNCFIMAQDIWYITYYINTISDALIYVLCDNDIRTYLNRRYRGIRHPNNRADSVMTITTSGIWSSFAIKMITANKGSFTDCEVRNGDPEIRSEEIQRYSDSSKMNIKDFKEGMMMLA